MQESIRSAHSESSGRDQIYDNEAADLKMALERSAFELRLFEKQPLPPPSSVSPADNMVPISDE